MHCKGALPEFGDRYVMEPLPFSFNLLLHFLVRVRALGGYPDCRIACLSITASMVYLLACQSDMKVNRKYTVISPARDIPVSVNQISSAATSWWILDHALDVVALITQFVSELGQRPIVGHNSGELFYINFIAVPSSVRDHAHVLVSDVF